jgi:asparaginyl-tRNA synthetase
MNARSTIKSIISHNIDLGVEITVSGWVRSRRTSKGGFSFIHVYDGSCFSSIQAVADSTLENYEDIQLLATGCAVSITGTLVASSGKGQDREIQATDVRVVGWVEDPETYPVSKKQHSYEYLRTVAHLRPRTNTFGAIARVRHAISAAVHQYFNNEGFYWVNTPIITASDCEGAGELFRVSTLDQVSRDAGMQTNYADDFFGTETFLTVSGQLNLESHACALGKVYTFGPTFRAENSNTSRHLAEFWMIEPEVAFADLSANAKLAENFLQYVIAEVLTQCSDDMEFFAERIDKNIMDRLTNVTANAFTIMSYSEAVELLTSTQRKFEFPVSWGTDLQSEHERFITEEVVQGPVVVTDYPREIKAFYMRLNDDERTVAAMDVLVPGIGEIIGGSQREERLDILDARMDPALAKELWWYRDLRRYGTVPHSGFGLGLERLVLYITGMDNIRDAIPFPRTPNNASF